MSAFVNFTELTEEIKNLQHTNKLLREEFIRKEKKLEEEVKRVEEANEELREVIDDLENTILHLESDKDDLEKENEKINRDKATLVRENVELGEELDGYKEELHIANFEYEKLKEETISRADHQKLVDFLNAEAEKYKVKYMEATGQLK